MLPKGFHKAKYLNHGFDVAYPLLNNVKNALLVQEGLLKVYRRCS